MSGKPRIAILGIVLESNSFAPVAGEDDFRSRYYFSDQSILNETRADESEIPIETQAFVRCMDLTGPWQPVPILLTGSQPAGPVDQEFFNTTLDDICQRLEDSMPLDGVYITAHGGMTATEMQDPDGEVITRVRAIVGENTVIIVTLDLHGNISERMVEDADMLIAYQTNPHVDMRQRGQEAAMHMRHLLGGDTAHASFIRLPLTPASINLLTETGPYAELISYGQRRQREHAGAILNVSILGGFVFSDTAKNGLAIIVTSLDDPGPGAALAQELAEYTWDMRAQFRKTLTSLKQAVELAKVPGDKALIFSDAGDNPGGGGRGNTTELLNALIESQAQNVLYGSFFDPELARQAHQLGPGAKFEALFNRQGETETSKQLSVPALVLALSDGHLPGRRGIFAGLLLELGPCCLLQIGAEPGIKVVVISARQQTADPVFFEQFNIDIGRMDTVCVKSRGHFRAGFDEWFKPGQVIEVDTAGLTSPVLERYNWRNLSRPVYPLDEDTHWP